MRTTSVISTISYNSPMYLTYKLQELYDMHKICDWYFVYHYAEIDETKNHIHLFIQPNTLIDTMDLQDFLREPDPKGNEKMLGCINFVKSNLDEWILYCSHYPAYLASKGQSRQYQYMKEDFQFCDEDTFLHAWNHAFYGSEWAKRNNVLRTLADTDASPAELIFNGSIPLNMASQVNSLWYLRTHYGMLDRDGRLNHEDNEYCNEEKK